MGGNQSVENDRVSVVESDSVFAQEIYKPRLTVAEFQREGSDSCQRTEAIIEDLASKYPLVKFIKIDIEKESSLAAERNVSQLPTFQFFVDGRMVDEIAGEGSLLSSDLEEKVVVNQVVWFDDDLIQYEESSVWRDSHVGASEPSEDDSRNNSSLFRSIETSEFDSKQLPEEDSATSMTSKDKAGTSEDHANNERIPGNIKIIDSVCNDTAHQIIAMNDIVANCVELEKNENDDPKQTKIDALSYEAKVDDINPTETSVNVRDETAVVDNLLKDFLADSESQPAASIGPGSITKSSVQRTSTMAGSKTVFLEAGLIEEMFKMIPQRSASGTTTEAVLQSGKDSLLGWQIQLLDSPDPARAVRVITAMRKQPLQQTKYALASSAAQARADRDWVNLKRKDNKKGLRFQLLRLVLESDAA